MKHLASTLALAAFLTLGAASWSAGASSVAASPRAPYAEEHAFKVDGGHSSVVFRVKHLGTSWFYGRFNSVEGSLVFDEAHPEACRVEVRVAAESVDTADEKRDRHVKSPDFLDARQFPELRFESRSVTHSGDTWKAKGELTLHGVTKPLEVDFQKVGEGQGFRGEEILGFHATFSIDRTDFGMDYSTEALGAEIELTVSLEVGAS